MVMEDKKQEVEKQQEVVEEVTTKAEKETAETVEESVASSVEIPFLIGKKIGMTRIFNDSGIDYPVTVVEAGPCIVTQVKTESNDGYSAVQLGFKNLKDAKTNKAQKGHFEKSSVSSKKHLKECRFENDVEYKVGDTVDVTSFELGDNVSVTGTSKGHGFAGHMKRHGFGGGRRSHGKNSVMRKSGSIGAGSDPSKVWLGTRMAGRMGNDKVTVKNLQVVRVDLENNLLFVSGAVPGANNEIIYIAK
jgi:large subunit ribosomal protein L3